MLWPALTGGSSTGTLSIDSFEGAEGVYTLSLSFFDENDGVSDIEILLNGEVQGSFQLDGDFGIPGVQIGNLVSNQVRGLELRTGDQIEIRGTRNGEEFVRIDQVNLIQTGEIPSITVQAEDMTLDGYRVETNWVGIADGDSLASLWGGGNTGRLGYTFDGDAATYTVIVNAFDENDGSSAVSLYVKRSTGGFRHT